MSRTPPSSLAELEGGTTARTTIIIDPGHEVGLVDRNIYGHFLESNFFGNITEGVFDETHPLALDGPGAAAGLRGDVIDACRELAVPLVRWPGGNFASGYHWEDGVGRRDGRPRRLDLAWIGEESNRFGTDEFLAWCALVGAEAYLVHSARSVDEAVRWVEYTNYTGHTSLTEARAANGHPEGYKVRYWGIGNEVWGPWQMGHRASATYASDAREHAWFMRRVDPEIGLVAVGPRSPEDQEWADDLLGRTGALIDYVSCHLYGGSLHLFRAEEYENVVTQSAYFETQLTAYADLLATSAHQTGCAREISISLDEWNMRHLEPVEWLEPRPGTQGGCGPRKTPAGLEINGEMRVNRYSPRTLADALFYAGVFNVLHRLAGLPVPVRMANTVNLVNANALLEVRRGGVVRSATYHVWDLYQRHVGTRVVKCEFDGPCATVSVRQGAPDRLSELKTRATQLPALDVIATTTGSNSVQLVVINRDRYKAVDSQLVCGGRYCTSVQAWQIGGGSNDVWASNSLEHPSVVSIRQLDSDLLIDGWYRFPPHTVTVLEWMQ